MLIFFLFLACYSNYKKYEGTVNVLSTIQFSGDVLLTCIALCSYSDDCEAMHIKKSENPEKCQLLSNLAGATITVDSDYSIYPKACKKWQSTDYMELNKLNV